MNAVGIIPVRLESTRLHEKAIADICGMPMFVHTSKRAKLAKTLDEVYLATDNDYIAEIAYKHDINIIMTSTNHKNSSERIAEACENNRLKQGDNVMLSTFGAGFSWGAMYLKWGMSTHA